MIPKTCIRITQVSRRQRSYTCLGLPKMAFNLLVFCCRMRQTLQSGLSSTRKRECSSVQLPLSRKTMRARSTYKAHSHLAVYFTVSRARAVPDHHPLWIICLSNQALIFRHSSHPDHISTHLSGFIPIAIIAGSHIHTSKLYLSHCRHHMLTQSYQVLTLGPSSWCISRKMATQHFTLGT